ncbi:hypothetical protein WPS_21670 [Vulcanimicrobium alpinum]|uniref:Amine oxidase domain-containing protein n=1 Tax=Vulcanimicrobium alpinum TaxID=3016050 RepID=A0AAN1XYC9_UNVUL|nr:NAD(P)/FAD-dependent oxidoreductase [Vulcanimicrobium alpinum]BDE06891.1 hypothetical protein WPS_21670 [Vulcanimicrobium alpinum]
MNEAAADVAVIGAGAAGLAAAHILCREGLRVEVLEARERIGGRLLPVGDPVLPVAVDLGGEFIHGSAPETFALLREAGTVAVDTVPSALAFVDGELRERDDPFDRTAHVLARAAMLREDVPVATFARDLDADIRRDLLMMVRGFDAADPARASTLALAAEWSDDVNGQTARQFRPLGGYACVLRAMHDRLDPACVRVRLGAPVRSIARDAGGVTVALNGSGGEAALRVRAAVVTVPIGVLQSGGLQFQPPLPAATQDALGRLVMGPVVKLALRFRTAFWERSGDGRARDIAFFQRAGAHFPTFWTLLPLRAPILIAWAGGPDADALAAYDAGARVRLALDDLRTLFGPGCDPHGELEAAYQHDWQSDPYARGAYSYLASGGMGARETLARPIDATLFFAGEATAEASEAGTVAGALRSGERAAREAIAALRIRRAS